MREPGRFKLKGPVRKNGGQCHHHHHHHGPGQGNHDRPTTTNTTTPAFRHHQTGRPSVEELSSGAMLEDGVLRSSALCREHQRICYPNPTAIPKVPLTPGHSSASEFLQKKLRRKSRSVRSTRSLPPCNATSPSPSNTSPSRGNVSLNEYCVTEYHLSYGNVECHSDTAEEESRRGPVPHLHKNEGEDEVRDPEKGLPDVRVMGRPTFELDIGRNGGGSGSPAGVCHKCIQQQQQQQQQQVQQVQQELAHSRNNSSKIRRKRRRRLEMCNPQSVQSSTDDSCCSQPESLQEVIMTTSC
ncbi:uncharacterized protein LOC143023030 isoform X1 [Oratosquilla oratoria]|uniref:uncharacterized protein LOC143023030 isoform X1 n=1 Tax=Oratosquilla oratoria TaxID=337810 RepID=UPI003F777E54